MQFLLKDENGASPKIKEVSDVAHLFYLHRFSLRTDELYIIFANFKRPFVRIVDAAIAG